MPRPPRESPISLAAVGKGDRQFVTALARGLDVLRCFDESRTALSVSEIAKATKMPQPTAWRLCHTLLKCGFLSPDGERDRLRIGLLVLGLGASSLAAAGLDNVIREEMNRISLKFHLAVSIAVRDQLEMVLVQRARGDGSLLLNLQVGSRLPMATSMFGIAYIANLNADDRANLFETFSEMYGTEWEGVRERIVASSSTFATKGFVGSYSSLYPGINSVALPVTDPASGQVLVLNCGGPDSSITPERMEQELIPDLQALASLVRSLSTLGKAGDFEKLR